MLSERLWVDLLGRGSRPSDPILVLIGAGAARRLARPMQWFVWVLVSSVRGGARWVGGQPRRSPSWFLPCSSKDAGARVARQAMGHVQRQPTPRSSGCSTESDQSSDSSTSRRSWMIAVPRSLACDRLSEGDAGVFFGTTPPSMSWSGCVDPVSLLDHGRWSWWWVLRGRASRRWFRAGLVPILTSHRPPDAKWLVVPPVVPGRRHLPGSAE